jgi:hypothetical protein
MPGQRWEALLDGELAARAREAARAVAAELAVLSAASAGEARGRPAASDELLAAEAPGLAVLFGYLDQAWPGEGYDDTALQFLGHATNAVGTRRMRAALYGGFTGVAWTVTHLQPLLLGPEAPDPVASIDDALLDYLSLAPWTRDYDLIDGLVGYGVYGLERLPRESGRAIVERAIDRLAETAQSAPEGATWRTAPGLLPEWQRERCPDGYYNLGLAHGVPGVIALIGAACAAGIRAEGGPLAATGAPGDGAPRLLEDAVDWLLAQRLAPGEGACFASWAGPGLPRHPSRLAWCYGDLGVAIALLVAARGVGNAAWEQEAVRIAHSAAERSWEAAGAQDAGLCHGAAGNAHLFNRLYQSTGDPRLGEAARAWFARALEMRRPDRGIGGFQAYMSSGANQDPRWEDDPGFLTGAAGVALALLAAVTPIEPEWDRMLLASARPPTKRGA